MASKLPSHTGSALLESAFHAFDSGVVITSFIGIRTNDRSGNAGLLELAEAVDPLSLFHW